MNEILSDKPYPVDVYSDSDIYNWNKFRLDMTPIMDSPQTVETEEKVVAALFQNKQLVADYRDLIHLEFFRFNKAKAVVRYLLREYDRGTLGAEQEVTMEQDKDMYLEVPDVEYYSSLRYMLADEFRFYENLQELFKRYKDSVFTYQVKEIVEKTHQMRLEDRMEKVSKLIKDIDGMDEKFTNKDPKENEFNNLLLKYLEENQYNLEHPDEIVRLSTGFTVLDNLLNDGYALGGLYMVAARPSVGKTSFAVDQHVKNRFNGSLFISFEVTKNEIFDQVLSVYSGYPTNYISKRQVDGDELEGLLESCNKPIHNREPDSSLLFIEKPNDVMSSIREVRRLICYYKRRFGVKFIVIDHLHSMDEVQHDGRPFESLYRQYTYMITKIKQLAVQYNVAILITAQLNRESEKRSGADKVPNIDELRDCGNIEGVVDVCMVLYREEMHNKGSREGLMDVIIGKNRNGARGGTVVEFNKANKRMKQSTVAPII